MRRINRFLLDNAIRVAGNPCISPDFCLDWTALSATLKAGAPAHVYAKSRFETAAGTWTLVEDSATGDCAWRLQTRSAKSPDGVLEEGVALEDGAVVFPATWDNLIRLKNAVQEHDAGSTVFPNAEATLGRSTLGIGARFTTLHWPAVEWAMSALDLGVTANQNSIPRELVYDVDAMLDNRLDTVPFPFIGTNVPEGHQGQSVEGMSHGCVLSKLKTGFHRRRIAWSFNADHQPIGGKFDAREDALVRGCLLASYITFDLSPELAQTQVSGDAGSWVKANVPIGFRRPGSRTRRVDGADCRRRRFREAPGLRLAGAAQDEASRRQVSRGARRRVHHGSRPTLPARTVHRRAAGPHDTRDDRGDAVALRGDGHARQLRGAGLRLPEEHAVPGQRRAARSDREAVGRLPRVRREHRFSLGVRQVG